jgi:beige protein homolog 1
MKAEPMPHDVVPHFLASLESLIKCQYNIETHRALALFITYALHTAPGSLPRTPKPFSALSRSSTPGIPRRPTVEANDTPVTDAASCLTKKQLGVKILEMCTGLLCEKGNLVDIRKFAKAVTNKVGVTKLSLCIICLRCSSGFFTSWPRTTLPL